MAQRYWQHLCSARMQVQLLAWSNGLKDPVLPQLWQRSQLWFRSEPWSGNAICHRAAKKEKKKKKKTNIMRGDVYRNVYLGIKGINSSS